MATIRRVATASDLRRQIDQIDREIIALLVRRTNAARKLHTQNEGEDDTEWEDMVMANWLEEGFDQGLDEPALQKVVRDVIDMGKKAAELA